MKRRLMLALALIVAVSMVFAACGGGGGGKGKAKSDEKYDFVVNATLGEPVSPNWDRLFKELQEESGGRIVTENNIYWSGSLIPIPEIPKGLGSGAAAFSNIPSNNYPDVLPLSTRILDLPFMGLQDPVDSAEIWMQLYDEFPEMQQEFTDLNIKVIAVTTLGMYGMHFADKKEVRLPEDLRGRKMVPQSQTFLQILEKYNASGSYIPPGQMYENLEKGVIEGYVNNWAFQGWFGLTDLIQQHVEFGDYGIFHEWNLLAVNLDFWNSLPADLQKLIEDKFRYDGGYKAMWDDTWNLVLNEKEKAKAKGDLFVTLTDAEIQQWKDVLLPTHEVDLAEVAAVKGDITYTIYERAKEIISDKYDK